MDINITNNIDEIYNYYYKNNLLKRNLINEFIENQTKIVERILYIIEETNEYNKLRYAFIFAKELIHKEIVIQI